MDPIEPNSEQRIVNWEHFALRALYQEYEGIVRDRRLKLTAAIELMDSDRIWGEWDANLQLIRLSRRLLKEKNWFQVIGVLKHEMAHQLAEQKNLNDRSHGATFQWACERIGVPSQFRSPTTDLTEHSLDWKDLTGNESTRRMLDKTKKLLSLANSNNEHEAALAMNRVRDIYARYNLEEARHSSVVHATVSRGTKRTEAYEKKIHSILVEHFFVQVIASKTFNAADAAYVNMIDIIGREENVRMAEYVFYFLLQQVDSALSIELKAQKLSRQERRSFRLGLLQGFSEKLKAAEQERQNFSDPPLLSRALQIFYQDKELDTYVRNIYPRLSRQKITTRGLDSRAYGAGKIKGRKIVINKPMVSRFSSERLLK